MNSIQIIQMPYRGEHNAPDQTSAPGYLDDQTLRNHIAADDLDVAPSATVELTPDEDAQYGPWQRVALANAHLARHVAEAVEKGRFPIGLLANCNSLPGMLAGLQRTYPRVGLIWIDAHADFNTPETTLSGMMGGMPVALSCGLCLHRLRETTGLLRPIDPADVLMLGLRDVDPLEQALLDEHDVTCLPLTEQQDDSMKRLHAVGELEKRTDAIYLHIDMDVLDPIEVAGHHLTVPGGPSSEWLSIVLTALMESDKVAALGIASAPAADLDPEGSAKRAAHALIGRAMVGLHLR